MLQLTAVQVEAIATLRREHGAAGVALHHLPDPDRAYVVLWRPCDSPAAPAWRGTISPTGVVHGERVAVPA